MIADLLMQLLSIETLCLAAEATAVLLLLAFAWPESKKQSNVSESEPIDWEPIKDCFLKTSLFRGLYQNQCQLSGATPAEPFPAKASDDSESQEFVPPPWRDRLTKCLNRNGFDAILNSWLTLQDQHREQSCISMVVLNEYSQMISSHGAMVTEQALQKVAKQLVQDLGSQAIVARYLPDRFAILHFASSLPTCCNAMAMSQFRIAEEGFFSHASTPLSIGCLISIASLSGDTDLATRVEELDAGGVEAEQSGRCLVAKQDGSWSDKLVTIDPSEVRKNETSHPEPSELADTSNPKAKDSEISTGESHPSTSLPEAQAPTAEAVGDAAIDSGDTELEVTPSSDISAVANPDDIAALFSQINSNKSNKPTAAAPTSAPTVLSAGESANPANAPVNTSDNASADDIAALFSAAKASAPPTPTAASPSQPPPPPQPPSAEDLGQAASADDIASLFAAAKASPATPTTSAANAPIPQSQPSAKQEVDSNESASADDIAALFASMKPAVKTATTPSTTPETASTTPDHAETNSVHAVAEESVKETIKPQATTAAEDLNESASADDIASLFAKMKPPAPPPAPVSAPSVVESEVPVEPAKPIESATSAEPAPSTEPIKQIDAPKSIDEMDMSGSASADDIASLFASVKPSMHKPNTPVVPITPPPAAEKPQAKPVPQKSSQQDLSEAATSDDIASLFASVKSGLKDGEAPKDSVSTPVPTPALPISEDQLGEVATADDIAMLFQTVQQANKNAKPTESGSTKEATPKTPANLPAEVPVQDLSSNASLDDIEALFAAMKK